MNKPKFKEKSDVPVGQLPNMPKVPIPVDGYVIYSQVALNIDNHFKIGADRQTALNLAIAKAILNGKLRSYDVGTGLPCEPGESSPYVRCDHVETWLKDTGYPLGWTGAGSHAHESVRPGKGTDKRWTDELVKALIQHEDQFKALGHRDWARRAAEKFNIDPSRARILKAEFRERIAKRRDVSSWNSPDK